MRPKTLSATLVGLVLLQCIAVCQDRFSGKVVGVADGDTISVMHEGRPLTVRLDAIDCPEDGQDFSARGEAVHILQGVRDDGTVDQRDTDRYGRTVARVYFDGQDLGPALVRAGFAWHFKRYSPDSELAKTEIGASV